jgi:glycosyltransferase involved in cell wall biosynthesis
MKIMQVIPFFTPNRGGSVVVPYNLSKELAKKGHQVTVITTDFELDIEYAQSIENVEVLPFECAVRLGLFLYSPKLKGWLKNNIKDFDIIHLHNFRSYQNNIVYKYAVKYGVPYVLQAHGSVPRIIEKQRLKWLYDIVWGYNILNNSKKIIAVSNIEVIQYERIGVAHNKIEVIPNGLNETDYRCLQKRGTFRKRMDINDDAKVVLYVGRLHKIKGIEFLINSFGSLTYEMNNVFLVIAGPDEGCKIKLEKLAHNLNLNNNIRFTGYLKNVSEAYCDADVLVYPSIYEIFGLVPFEAILCGTPVIVTDDCGCSKLIEVANCGQLVKYGDFNDLKAKMKLVLENPQVGKNAVNNGKHYIDNNLLWERIVLKMEECYENCIRNL